MATAYSIRKSLQGELQDFLVASGLVNCTPTASLVRDLTALLAAYREEDVPLYPSVFVLSSIDQLSAIAPGTKPVVIGAKSLDEIEASMILKDCAPLAENGWSIFVCKADLPARFQYGLFRSLSSTVATSADEAMDQTAGTSAILVIRNRGHLVVELRNAKNDVFTAALTSATATESHFSTHVATLADALSEDLTPEMAESFKPYLRRFLSDTLQRCHGTLCAVLKAPADGIAPQRFAKSVWLVERLRWAEIHAVARTHRSAEALSDLQAVETLVVGMIRSDGVVILGSDGTVLGYRAFLHPDDKERQQQVAEGGGRYRTFGLMKGRLGADLRAAFFRSQDGTTECERAIS